MSYIDFEWFRIDFSPCLDRRDGLPRSDGESARFERMNSCFFSLSRVMRPFLSIRGKYDRFESTKIWFFSLCRLMDGSSSIWRWVPLFFRIEKLISSLFRSIRPSPSISWGVRSIGNDEKLILLLLCNYLSFKFQSIKMIIVKKEKSKTKLDQKVEMNRNIRVSYC